jgi:hypothetical protein
MHVGQTPAPGPLSVPQSRPPMNDRQAAQGGKPFESHSASFATTQRSLRLATPNLSSQCWRAWLSAPPTPAPPERRRATVSTVSSVTSTLTKSGVALHRWRDDAPGVLASGCLASSTSATESPGPCGTAWGIRNFYFWNPATCASEFGRGTMRACSACKHFNSGGNEKATKNELTFEERCWLWLAGWIKCRDLAALSCREMPMSVDCQFHEKMNKWLLTTNKISSFIAKEASTPFLACVATLARMTWRCHQSAISANVDVAGMAAILPAPTMVRC